MEILSRAWRYAVAVTIGAVLLAVAIGAAADHGLLVGDHDTSGLSYTLAVRVNSAWMDERGFYRHSTALHDGEIQIDVSGYAALMALRGATYDVTLYCPPAVTLASGEAASRTGIAAGTPSVFRIQVASKRENTLEERSWRCWLWVKVNSITDVEDNPVLSIHLPVTVTHRHFRRKT